VLSVSTGSYDTANLLNGLNKEIPIDDRERAEIITDFVASHLDAKWLHQRCGTPREMRLSPAVFRYQLIQRAQAANKRIVLPEGSEQFTVQAAANAGLPVACCWPNLQMSKPSPAPKASSCRLGWRFLIPI
jgi:phosphate acetyltransferase